MGNLEFRELEYNLASKNIAAVSVIFDYFRLFYPFIVKH